MYKKQNYYHNIVVQREFPISFLGNHRCPPDKYSKNNPHGMTKGKSFDKDIHWSRTRNYATIAKKKFADYPAGK